MIDEDTTFVLFSFLFLTDGPTKHHHRRKMFHRKVVLSVSFAFIFVEKSQLGLLPVKAIIMRNKSDERYEQYFHVLLLIMPSVLFYYLTL